MKTKCRLTLCVIILYSSFILSSQAQGTAFTYSGNLNDGGGPATGLYDLRFALYDSLNAGTQQGATLTTTATPVTNGLFTVTLDFGNQFPGADRWLEIGVRATGGGSFTTLAPRQKITPTPYAITAGSVASGGIPAGTYANAVVFNNSANSFSGDGSGLTGLNASQLTNGALPASVLGNAWQTTGNSGTTPGVNFVGTTDATPLDLRARGTRGLELSDGFRSTGLFSGVEGMNVIGGMYSNYVDVGVLGATIAGGGYIFGSFLSPTIVNNSIYSDLGAIGGGSGNVIGLNSPGSVVAGGSYNADWNGSTNSAIGGGYGHQIYSVYSAIAGGYGNIIGSLGQYNIIGCGSNNLVEQGVTGGVIGGGGGNDIGQNSMWSVVAGGSSNAARPGSTNAAVGGGFQNQTYASYATIAGGYENTIGPGGLDNTIGGGFQNLVYGAIGSVIGGGQVNQISGSSSTVPGGVANEASGDDCFAAGSYAHADHNGCFIWADTSGVAFPSIRENEFAARVTGGVRFVTGLDPQGHPIAGVSVAPGASAWGILCDRNAKKNFAPLDGEEVLRKLEGVPIQTWNYKWESDDAVPNIGPMAQDFKAAFYPGRDDKIITTLEFDGVELAAIKGLDEKVEVRSQRAADSIRKLEAENTELRRRLEALERIVLNQKPN